MDRADDGVGVGALREDADETLVEDLVDEVSDLDDVMSERGDEIVDGRRAETLDGVEKGADQEGDPTSSNRT